MVVSGFRTMKSEFLPMALKKMAKNATNRISVLIKSFKFFCCPNCILGNIGKFIETQYGRTLMEKEN
jgi:hypothetical protein